MPPLNHCILAWLILHQASSLNVPLQPTHQRTARNSYNINGSRVLHPPKRISSKRYMSDTKTKTTSFGDDELITRIYEDVDGIGDGHVDSVDGSVDDSVQPLLSESEAVAEDVIENVVAEIASSTIISLDDSAIPLDSETKEKADIMAENIVTEIINSEPLSMTKEIDEFVFETKNPSKTKVHVKETANPGVRKIIRFAIPAIGVWLCGPILSLIDTAAVGLLAGTKQQAGLNPAVAICDYSALLIAFLYTATTNMIATAQEDEKDSAIKTRTIETLVSSLQISGFVGLLLGVTLMVTSKQAILGIIGSEAVDPVVFSAAMKYVNIRAIGMPAAAIIGSAQAACLGMQDIRSPLYVLAAAAVVNFFGDVFFVGQKAAWLGGAAGAAWATVISQYAALVFFTKWLTFKSKTPSKSTQFTQESGIQNDTEKRFKVTKKILNMATSSTAALELKRKRIKSSLKKLHNSIQGNESENSTKNTKASNMLSSFAAKIRKTGSRQKNSEQTFSAKGFLADHLRSKHFFELPDKDLAQGFAPYVVPVTLTSVGRVSSYVAMAHVVASSFGTLSMAAQQIITSCFCCLTPVADSLSLTGQSFVPGVFEKSNTPEGADDLWRTTVDFIKAGSLFGLAIAATVSFVPLLSGFFTSDLRVISLVNSVVPTLSAIFFTHAIMCAAEGVLLGQKDLSFLGKAYSFFFFAIPYLMLRVKKAAIAGLPVSLASLWQVFLGYNIVRMSSFVLRTKICADRRKKLAIKNEDIVI